MSLKYHDVMVRHQGADCKANWWIWMIGRLCLENDFRHVPSPTVGDLVIETSHLYTMGLRGQRVGLYQAIGTLTAHALDDAGLPKYRIHSIDPESGEHWWNNSDVYVLSWQQR